jgi:hypothetical protein
MRVLLCFLLGHKAAEPVVIIGVEVRTCPRCGRTL